MLINKQTVYITKITRRPEGGGATATRGEYVGTPVTPLAPCFPRHYKEDKWKSAK